MRRRSSENGVGSRMDPAWYEKTRATTVGEEDHGGLTGGGRAGRPHLLLKPRPQPRDRRRDRADERRRRYRVVHLAPRLFPHRAGAARQPLPRLAARGDARIGRSADTICRRPDDRRESSRRLHRPAILTGGIGARCHRHGCLDPDGSCGPPFQRAGDRGSVRRPGRQVRVGKCGRRARGDALRLRIRSGGALDPRGRARDERRYRRRHHEDRGLRQMAKFSK